MAGSTERKGHVSSCECGQLSISLSGEPDWVNACACRNCQKRSNGPLTLGLWFRRDRILGTTGESQVFRRSTDKGNEAERHFCPRCGSTVFWFISLLPNRVGVNWGGTQQPTEIRPSQLVWSRSFPRWLELKESVPQYLTQPEPRKRSSTGSGQA